MKLYKRIAYISRDSKQTTENNQMVARGRHAGYCRKQRNAKFILFIDRYLTDRDRFSEKDK